jgi:protein gp37
MKKTIIAWTTFSANPLRYRDAAGRVVWACVRASQGCQNCYAEELALRFHRGGPFTVTTTNALTPFLDDRELTMMRRATVIDGLPVSGSRCFIGDMTDLFGEWVPTGLLHRLFTVLEARRDVTWQVLTKRADRLQRYLTKRWIAPPPAHIWVGVSAENQEWIDKRVPQLLDTPAAVRFVSYEPALGPADFTGYLPHVNWIIIGGESGPHFRQMDVTWARAVRDQCRRANVACFFKQNSARYTETGIRLDGTIVREYPVVLRRPDDEEFALT